MDRNNYWTRRVRRRRMLQGAGVGVAGVAAVGLVGCGDDDDDDDGTTVPGASPTNTTEGSTPEATATPVPAGPKRGNARSAQAAKVYDTVDPHRSVASPALVMLNRAQSKLLRFTNPNTGEIAADLAETWESPDASTVVLNIREGVKWHDVGPGAENPASTAGARPDDGRYHLQHRPSEGGPSRRRF